MRLIRPLAMTNGNIPRKKKKKKEKYLKKDVPTRWLSENKCVKYVRYKNGLQFLIRG